MSSGHRSSSASRSGTIKFPDLPVSQAYSEEAVISEYEGSPSLAPTSGGALPDSRWHPRQKGRVTWSKEVEDELKSRPRQKSLNEALRNIRGRRSSVTESAHEIADALKAPVSPMLVLLCCFWYMTSIFSNASSKSILIAFRYPVTLTIVQFAFVSSWCVLSSFLAHRFPLLQTWIPELRYKIRRPSKDIILATLPLTAFQIGGHILNSDAMARIPVALVHTIKGLSPLLTVLTYRLVFRVHYSASTYLSLVPLTIGVVMVCSANVSGDFLGLIYAFGSAFVFVAQNIVSKRLFNDAARAESERLSKHVSSKKPDKLNLLCYSSGLALLFTFPIWVWSEGWTLVSEFLQRGSIELSKRPDALDHGRLTLEFIFNGTFHFAQSLVAFVLLSIVSPVTYSVASLVKRVFVITFAVVWFGNPIKQIQAFGIVLTFLGLYLYDRTNDAARADRKARILDTPAAKSLLPVFETSEEFAATPELTSSPASVVPHAASWLPANGWLPGHSEQKRRQSDADSRKPPAFNQPAVTAGWLPPGTRQEQTWNLEELHKTPNPGPAAVLNHV